MNTIKYSNVNLKPLKRFRYKKDVSINELINNRKNKVSLHTGKGDLALLEHLNRFFKHDISVKSIDSEFCHAFAKYLINNAKIKINSATTYLQKLHALLQEAVYMGYIDHNPMPPMNRLLPKYIPRERACLTIDEIRKLETTPCPHEVTKLAFLFSCYTGLRLSDIETLRWEHIRKQTNFYMIEKIQVKTNNEVCIPLSKQALEILKRLKRKNISTMNYIFPMLSRTTICTDLKIWAKNAGIDKHVTFHVSRISFVTLFISAGVNMYVISKLCGHKNIKTTQVYARMIDLTYANAIICFEKLFKQKKRYKTTSLEADILLE